MKLILAIMRDSVEDEILHQLSSHQFRVTRIASTGGFLRRGNVTLLIGVEDERLDNLLKLIKESCTACKPESDQPTGQSSVTLFILKAKSFEQI
jgi:uncharacterized protein YaaQ